MRATGASYGCFVFFGEQAKYNIQQWTTVGPTTATSDRQQSSDCLLIHVIKDIFIPYN